MDNKFNPKRLSLARQRRRLTGKGLAQAAGLSAMAVSRLENGLSDPDNATISALASALRYPAAFFFADDPDELDTASVSFRSLTKMSAKEKAAAQAAGILGLEISDWLEKEFRLPEADFVDLSYEANPEAAAKAVRTYWGLGEKPITNMLGLLEVKGVRVFSLSEATKNVDAFSFWRDERPFIFLNNFKTAERSIFDSAHELAHLVMHRHAGTQPGDQPSRIAEREADGFASAFLMPANDVRSRLPRFITVDVILKAKARWRVSAMALAYRAHRLGLMTDWQYKSACIELGRRGYRTDEPNGVERETSAVWRKVLAALWSERTTRDEIAAKVNLPPDELEGLIGGLVGPAVRPERASNPPKLRLA
ncbi:helix-turn-helix domain-containing protein [Rhodobium gokarnense]|uniref:Zn-dependent peptidase ImmA (M78 family)/DNA-binding XRE family transcriptional regulator n=1 Tax=Rhodobium gokarnense TaxID=364296 RepID=A0ABT3HIP6_9HYPH|nr:XRE family transcriptional regulator [Rhodobium gokarnense]MCW2310278.1 Zn-dependent peptidase ImmA (M78 family)/DNA-binding XRE family transcriptional regulator [Rhodobium gokarnense]